MWMSSINNTYFFFALTLESLLLLSGLLILMDDLLAVRLLVSPLLKCEVELAASAAPSSSSAAPSVSSCRTRDRRCSNSPGIMAPAVKDPRSNSIRVAPRRGAGTSLAAIRMASAQTMAVFPTPGSPNSTTLFLERRLRICKRRRISDARPTWGSNLPERATALMSRPYFESEVTGMSTMVSSALAGWLYITRLFLTALRMSGSVKPSAQLKISVNRLFSAKAMTRCSKVSFASDDFFRTSSAFRNSSFMRFSSSTASTSASASEVAPSALGVDDSLRGFFDHKCSNKFTPNVPIDKNANPYKIICPIILIIEKNEEERN
mmetsp:Transcript_25208/g.45739  ORF Transcript_25208/g.45739 Transcript_25208/m.45739 type:complete len:320 (+) Transcript_25208:1150-2109(+)